MSVKRPGQRRRTRKAIVDATITLLARGETPSVADVAAAADVSRRTVYLYFPTFDHLLLDATVGALSQASVDRAIDAPSPGGSVADRVERMVRALHHVSPEVEHLGRELIRLTVNADGLPGGEQRPRRGYRRRDWIDSALSPLRDRVSPAQWRRLAAALAMVVGWEALIVQRAVCGLTAPEGEELSVWAARVLLNATLEEALSRRRHGGPRRSRARAR